jgi:glutamate racemase
VRIAFFDSGIGGLTVLKQALAALPNEEYLYFADTRNVPYGVRPKDEVLSLILSAAEFLARQDIRALVVACNTATSAAIGELRRRYPFPVIGMEPAVKPALARNAGKKVLVAATSLTLRESKLETLIVRLDSSHRVERRELDGLVTFAERFDFDSPLVRGYLEEKFAHTDWSQYETLVLGCTHFIYYRSLLQALAGDGVQLLDGNAGTVNHLVNTVGANRSATPPAGGRVRFYSSGGEEETPERVRRLLGLLAGPL